MNIEKAKRIVIKIGSTLVADEKGDLRKNWLHSLSDDIAKLKKSDKEIVIVTSGAVALGRRYLGLTKTKDSLKLEQKQAAAACGQVALAEAYRQSLSRHNITMGQILLSLEDSENRRRYLNARSTFETLLTGGVVPVVNENDTVATEEIRVGDNDRLAARVAQMIEADLLILLSDVDGLYTENPMTNPAKAKHIPVVDNITDKIAAMADGKGSHESSGGMTTKIMAARIATGSGCNTIITIGKEENPIKRLLEGGKHTLFTAKESPRSARKKWIADGLKATGKIIIDDGAVAALGKGKSLLPAGVVSVEGKFQRGDAVSIRNQNGKEIGRGLVAYSIEDAEKIIRHNSKDIEKILGYSGRDALIHRNDLVLV